MCVRQEQEQSTRKIRFAAKSILARRVMPSCEKIDQKTFEENVGKESHHGVSKKPILLSYYEVGEEEPPK